MPELVPVCLSILLLYPDQMMHQDLRQTGSSLSYQEGHGFSETILVSGRNFLLGQLQYLTGDFSDYDSSSSMFFN